MYCANRLDENRNDDDRMKQLEQLMELAHSSSAVTRECICSASPVAGWERVPPSFPESQMRQLWTLVADPFDEPTYLEFHPSGTNYWSENAPIASHFYPYNRCTVAQCVECGRAYLRYTEAGGYYVEPRIRALNPQLIVDARVPAR